MNIYRRPGRKSPLITLALHHLPDDKLFSPLEITERYFPEKGKNRTWFKKNIDRLADRNGIEFTCDNPELDELGQPKRCRDKALIPQGGEYRWLGSRWKDLLADRDRDISPEHIAEIQSLFAHLPLSWEGVLDSGPVAPKRRIRLLALVSLALLCLTTLAGITPQGRQLYFLIIQGKWQEASSHLSVRQPSTPYERYLQSYMLYANENYEEAERSANQLMGDDPSIRTHALYLLACILRETHRSEEAFGFMHAGLKRAQRKGQSDMEYFLATLLSHYHLVRKEFNIAQDYLNQAFKAHDQIPPSRKISLNFALAEQGKWYFLQGQYSEALCVSWERLAYNKIHDSPKIPNVYAEIALIYSLMNHPKAFHYHQLALEAETIWNEKQKMHRRLRSVAVLISLGAPKDRVMEWSWVDDLFGWARMTGSLEIQAILELVLHQEERLIIEETPCHSSIKPADE